MTDCIICCSTVEQLIECPVCKHNACLECNKTYLGNLFDPKCMDCGKEWSELFIRENFPTKWYQEVYIENKKNKYIIREEQSKLPIVSEYSIKLAQENKLKTHLKDLKTQIKTISKLTKEHTLLSDQIKNLTIEIKKSSSEYDNYVKKCSKIDIGESPDSEDPTKPTKNFMKCNTNNCPGFLHSDGNILKCGSCPTVSCKHCLEPYVHAHKCDPNVLANIKAIMNDKNSRMCPKCNQRIEKERGCDQMFCISCKTSFSFSTGIIETRVFHNPHLYDYLSSIPNGQQELSEYANKQAKTADELQQTCDYYRGFGHGIFEGNHILELKNMINTIFNGFKTTGLEIDPISMIEHPVIRTFFAYLLNFIEIQGEYLKTQRSGDEFTYYEKSKILNLEDIHIKYINKQITSQRWKKLVLEKYIKRDYLTEVFSQLNMFITIMGDIASSVHRHVTTLLTKFQRMNKDQLLNCYQKFLSYIRENIIPSIETNINLFNRQNIKISIHYEYPITNLILFDHTEDYPTDSKVKKVAIRYIPKIVYITDVNIKDNFLKSDSSLRKTLDKKYNSVAFQKIINYYLSLQQASEDIRPRKKVKRQE